MKWESSNFYPRKYENLHQCKLSFVQPKEDSQDISIYIIYALSEFFNFGISTETFRVDLNEFDASKLNGVDLVAKVYHELQSKFLKSETFTASLTLR